MNDNDIIKALECCRIRECNNCVRLKSGHKEECKCRLELLEIVFDLINRQKAEIERLNHIRAELLKEIDRLKTEMSYMKSPNTIGDTHEMGAW